MTAAAVPLFFRKLGSITLLLTAIAAGELHGQDRLDPVAMGEARASVASVRGLGAIAGNPGALDLPTISWNTLAHPLTFSIYSVGGTIGSTFLSGSEFSGLFGESSTQNRQRMADLLSDNERLFANGAINLLSVRYGTKSSGAFGLHYGHRIFARINFPGDLTQLIATLNIAGQDFRFVNDGIGGDWITELGFSYGKSFGNSSQSGWLPTVGVGTTVKLLQGVAHFDLEENSLITIDQIELQGRLAFLARGGYIFRSAVPNDFDPGQAVSNLPGTIIPSTAGTGFGADFGISGVLYRMPPERQGETAKDALYFGMTLQDLGSVVWNTNAYERRKTAINDTIPSASLTREQLETYQGTLVRVPDFTTSLPSVFRAGLAMNVGAFASGIAGSLIVNAEGELPLDNVPGNLDQPRVAFGADWAPNRWLALRTGFSAGGFRGVTVGLGVGVRPFDWLGIDLGSSEINGLFDGKRIDFAARIAFGIRIDPSLTPGDPLEP